MAVLDLNSVASKIYTRCFIYYIIIHTEKLIWHKNFNFIGLLKTSFYGNLKTCKSRANNISKHHITLNPTSSYHFANVYSVWNIQGKHFYVFKTCSTNRSVDILKEKKCVWEC